MKIVITAGGTSEAIDKVRKITNMSKGTLGNYIAFEAMQQSKITKVYYLSPNKPDFPIAFDEGEVVWILTTSASSVEENLKKILSEESIDVVIHAMAVSDYTVDHLFTLEDMVKGLVGFIANKPVSEESLIEWFKAGNFRLDNSSKVSSKSNDLYIKLKPTEKIISKIKKWSPSTKLVGFKLLENVTQDHLIEIASQLKVKNDCDYVFCNDIKLIRESGHQGFLLCPDGSLLGLKGVKEISKLLIEQIVGGHHV
jgi:phosphopantothenate--cysteine ligase